MTWAVCTDTFPVRPWSSRCRPSPRFGTVWVREYTTLLDRSYWHPCTKGHVAQCRGCIGLASRSLSRSVDGYCSGLSWIDRAWHATHPCT